MFYVAAKTVSYHIRFQNPTLNDATVAPIPRVLDTIYGGK